MLGARQGSSNLQGAAGMSSKCAHPTRCGSDGVDCCHEDCPWSRPTPNLVRGTKTPSPETMRRYYRELDEMEQARRPTGGNEACD